MTKEKSGWRRDGWARVCDTCRSAACTVYCRADSAYLCTGCDARIHAANQVASRHERVWVCASCERAPAAFICKADAASLCATCDADIHSANPLARRHHRVPIQPISGCLYGPPATDPGGQPAHEEDGFLHEPEETIDEEDEDEAASWLLLNPVKNNNNNNGFLFGGEADEYLDLVEYNSCPDQNHFTDEYNQQHEQQQQQHYISVPQKNYGGDSVVPVQCEKPNDPPQQPQQQHNFQLGIGYEPSKADYSYNPSNSHSALIKSTNILRDSLLSKDEPKLAIPLLLLTTQHSSVYEGTVMEMISMRKIFESFNQGLNTSNNPFVKKSHIKELHTKTRILSRSIEGVRCVTSSLPSFDSQHITEKDGNFELPRCKVIDPLDPLRVVAEGRISLLKDVYRQQTQKIVFMGYDLDLMV